MTLTSSAEPQGLRPHAEVLAQYRRDWPLFDAYRRLIETHNAHDAPITESQTPPGALDCHTAAALALREHGMSDDRLTALMAVELFRRLDQEISSLSVPPTPSVASTLIGHFLQYGDRVPTVETWEALDADEQSFTVEELAERMPGEVLPELLRLAMPALLRHVIDEDEQALRRRMSSRQLWDATRRGSTPSALGTDNNTA